MFEELYTEFIKQKLTSYAETMATNTGQQYDLRITSTIDFRPAENEDNVCANIIYGAESKIEGSPSSYFRNFSITVWAERNTDGSYAKELFGYLFDELSMKSIKLTADSTSYSIFSNFGSLMLLDSRYQSGIGYRCKYVVTGQLIYSTAAQIGRHTYIAFPTSSSDSPTYYEVNAITPSESRNNNMSPKSTAAGVAYIKGAKSYTGRLGIIFTNDDTVSMKMVKYVHGAVTIPYLWIKYEYQDYTVIEKKLIIGSVNVALDETTRNTVITIDYVKDDVYGI